MRAYRAAVEAQGRTGYALRPSSRRKAAMTNHVYKLVDLVGSSTAGTDDAIRNAIETAALTIRNIDWFEVVESRGHVQDGKVAHYQVTLKVGFRIEGD
jgi:flavin-binding protein dodecin